MEDELTKVESFVSNSLGVKIRKSGSTILVDTEKELNNNDVLKESVKDSLEHGRLLWKENTGKIVMWATIVISVLFEFYFIKQFVLSFYSFDRSYLDNMFIFIPLMLPCSFLLTMNDNFNYVDLKMGYFKSGLLFAGIKLLGLLFYFTSDFTAGIVRFVAAFGAFPMSRIVLLGYALNGVLISVAALLIYKTFEDGFDDVCKNFEPYKLSKELGPSTSKFEYSAAYIKNIENKKIITIPEKDRMLHLGIIGATGSGKTATVILPLVFADLKKKYNNTNYVKKTSLKMIKKGKFEIVEPFSDIDFSLDSVKPIGGKSCEKIYNRLKNIRPCGITVVGPDDSLSDKVYDMAKLFNFKVNRIDPLPDSEGKYKEGYTGINPLHLSETTPEWAKDRERIKRATLFADVMQFVYEMNGKSDPYFSSINRVGTTYISLLLMITMPEVDGRHPNPVDVQKLLNDFDKIGPYHKKLKELSKANGNKYDVIVTSIYKDFIEEAGRKVFEQHSRGLKTQLNDFLTDTLITDLFTAENVIDFDKVLRDGDITVINIELGQLGSVNAPALGLFISMLMNNAVLSRPGNEETRMPHFLFYDEFPIFASPALEGAFTLYRKFRVGLTVAMQTTDQMNKTPFLSYMKGVILNSCRSLVFFGGANVTDMELVNKMGGISEDYQSQRSVSHTSLTVENPYINFSERLTAVETDVVSASDVRYTDFKEVHYFYTVDGNPMPVVKGKLEFVKKSELKKRKPIVYDFNEYYKPKSVPPVIKEDEEIIDGEIESQLEEQMVVTSPEESSEQNNNEAQKTDALGFDPGDNIFSKIQNTSVGNELIVKESIVKVPDKFDQVIGKVVELPAAEGVKKKTNSEEIKNQDTDNLVTDSDPFSVIDYEID